MGCSPWGHEESDTTEQLRFHFSLSSIGEGNGNPLQCSCLENPRDRGAWWAAVYGVAQSQTWLKRLSSSSMLGITWGSRCQRIPSSEKLLTQITANTWHSRDLNSHLILKPDWFNKARVMEILLPFTVNWRKCLALCGSLGIWWPPKNFLSSCTCRSWSLFFKPPWIWVGLWLITGILWWYCGFFSCVHG